jgi:hypothetical protein
MASQAQLRKDLELDASGIADVFKSFCREKKDNSKPLCHQIVPQSAPITDNDIVM